MDHAPTWASTTAGLADGERILIEQKMRAIGFARGAYIVQESAPCHHLYVLQRGRVKAWFVDPGGRERIAGVIGPGTVVGIVANLTGTAPILTLEAIDDVAAAAIRRSDFMACMDSIPKFGTNVAKLVAGMYQRQIDASKGATDPAPIRLGKVLYELATLPGRPGAASGSAITGVRHQDLAAMVGASRGWTTQMLATYEEKGLLTCGRRSIRIADVASLVEYVRELEREIT